MPVHDSAVSEQNSSSLPAQKINLALRRTADQLLRQAGDSTSRIPPVIQSGKNAWRVILLKPFNYDRLPEILQTSLDIHSITQSYDVTVRRCKDNVIDLGYSYLDFAKKTGVACNGREMPSGCHYIEITFIQNSKKNSLETYITIIILIMCTLFVGVRMYRRQKLKPAINNDAATDWIEFGNSRLDLTNQILMSNNVRQTLTFREAKLMMLFATHPGQLLERDFIIRKVWADEGVLVGRSVDVFVSRLRKKLAGDTSVGLSVVHGVGYRLETVKVG